MSLIKCPECKKQISDTVKKCPFCGKRILQPEDFGMIGGFAIVFILLFIGIVNFGLDVSNGKATIPTISFTTKTSSNRTSSDKVANAFDKYMKWEKEYIKSCITSENYAYLWNIDVNDKERMEQGCKCVVRKMKALHAELESCKLLKGSKECYTNLIMMCK